MNKSSWKSRADLPEDCLNGACVVFDGELFLLGGTNGVSMRYIPSFDEWTCTIKSPPKHKRSGAVLYRGGRILLFGANDTSTVHEYNALTNEWGIWNTQTPPGKDLKLVLKMNLSG
jgi:hypothetical protein